MEDGLYFEWDEANVDHVARHDVTVDEAEEAAADPKRIGIPAHEVDEEERWALLGATESDRVLFVVFTKRDKAIRVITARDATSQERRRYRR
jgi:uncharacterized DUF497 family protein